jgi:malonate decarboxylase gamma subunit
MTLDDALESLFPAGSDVQRGPHGTAHGMARLAGGKQIVVTGVIDGTPVGVDTALELSARVLEVMADRRGLPILVLVDASSQNMARRDELLGLNEYLAHLIKVLALAALGGNRTIGVLYGGAAAGAFIATALSTRFLAALDEAHPSVMDLPSISRVTKLPLDALTQMAKSTPIFAPGANPLFKTGAIRELWDSHKPLAGPLEKLLAEAEDDGDRRDAVGQERKGRLQAAAIAKGVAEAASQFTVRSHGLRG